MKLKSLLIVLTFTMCSSLASTAISAEWSGYQNISELFVHTNTVEIKLSTIHPNPGQCSVPTYLTLDSGSSPLFKEIYSLLLAAKMSSIKIDVAVEGCGSIKPQHPRIAYVRVQ